MRHVHKHHVFRFGSSYYPRFTRGVTCIPSESLPHTSQRLNSISGNLHSIKNMRAKSSTKILRHLRGTIEATTVKILTFVQFQNAFWISKRRSCVCMVVIKRAAFSAWTPLSCPSFTSHLHNLNPFSFRKLQQLFLNQTRPGDTPEVPRSSVTVQQQYQMFHSFQGQGNTVVPGDAVHQPA